MNTLKIVMLVLMVLSASSAMAEKGIVLNASDVVQYKFDTDTTPELSAGEYIVLREDINTVERGAEKQGDAFINPLPMAPEEEIRLTATQDPTKPTQVIISTGAGALGAAGYLFMRRKKTA